MRRSCLLTLCIIDRVRQQQFLAVNVVGSQNRHGELGEYLLVTDRPGTGTGARFGRHEHRGSGAASG